MINPVQYHIEHMRHVLLHICQTGCKEFYGYPTIHAIGLFYLSLMI